MVANSAGRVTDLRWELRPIHRGVWVPSYTTHALLHHLHWLLTYLPTFLASWQHACDRLTDLKWLYHVGWQWTGDGQDWHGRRGMLCSRANVAGRWPHQRVICHCIHFVTQQRCRCDYVSGLTIDISSLAAN